MDDLFSLANFHQFFIAVFNWKLKLNKLLIALFQVKDFKKYKIEILLFLNKRIIKGGRVGGGWHVSWSGSHLFLRNLSNLIMKAASLLNRVGHNHILLLLTLTSPS